jgi:NAD(P)-dependent dehydrogenase (short-subunit alcohol dehydrogenase family)
MAMATVEDKVTIITGAGEGLGRVMAERFSAGGAPVVLAGRRAELLVETASQVSGPVLVVPTDVTHEDQVRNLVAEAVDRFGRVDVLLNNAAQPGTDLFIWEQTLDNWNNTIAVDVTAAMLCTREVLAQSMLERRSGSIVNFSSTAGWNGLPRKSHYSVAKAALRTLTKVSALEAGPHGIRVNCLVPGGIDTELLQRYLDRVAGEQGITSQQLREQWVANVPLRKISSPDEITELALFLASDAASAITGQSINADAGGVMIG